MRGLPIFLLLLTLCHEWPIKAILQYDGKSVVIDFAEPREVPENVLPHSDKYVIQTRIIIEGSVAQLANVPPQQLWAITPDKAMKQLKVAEEIYADLGLKFYVSEITFVNYSCFYVTHWIDSVVRPGIMSIHYMLPNDFPFSGLSSFPWKPYTRGILLGFGCSDTTLAHEIGHYFGLLHTFNEEFFESDLVDDTPKQSASKCEGEEGGTPNCKNILSYCDHFPKCVTPGQIKRMRRFLRASRTNHLASNEPESIFVSGLPQVQTIDVFNP